MSTTIFDIQHQQLLAECASDFDAFAEAVTDKYANYDEAQTDLWDRAYYLDGREETVLQRIWKRNPETDPADAAGISVRYFRRYFLNQDQ